MYHIEFYGDVLMEPSGLQADVRGLNCLPLWATCWKSEQQHNFWTVLSSCASLGCQYEIWNRTGYIELPSTESCLLKVRQAVSWFLSIVILHIIMSGSSSLLCTIVIVILMMRWSCGLVAVGWDYRIRDHPGAHFPPNSNLWLGFVIISDSDLS